MDRKSLYVILSLVSVLVFFLLIAWVGPMFNESLQLDETALMRFLFVGLGLLIVFIVYWMTKSSKIWEVGTREVVYMAIGAALYAIFSYLFNGTVFVVPSVSQVALRPAIVIPMFFGFYFGPVVGFFTGAVGTMFGDALTGFGLSPQWAIGNGFIGMISGMALLYPDYKKGLNRVLITSTVIVVLTSLVYLIFRNTPNTLFYDVANNIFGDQQITLFAGLSLLIGFLLVLGVRLIFRNNLVVAAAVTWGMLGNLLGLLFPALSDIWINGYSFAVAIVGEYIPAAGPNLIFTAILLPFLVIGYEAVRRQSGR